MSREAIQETVYNSIRHYPIDDNTLDSITEDVVNAIIYATGGDQHIVYCDGDGIFTLRHPVSERFEHEGLWECQYQRLVRTAAEQGAFSPHTRHRVWIDRGALMWEEVAP